MLLRTTYNDGKHLSTNDHKALQSLLNLEDLMEREKSFIKKNKLDDDNVENILEYLDTRQKRLSRFNYLKPSIEDCKKKTPEDKKTLEILNSSDKDLVNYNGLEIKLKSLDKKGLKQIKAKICSDIEKEPHLQETSKFGSKKFVDLLSLEGLQDLESDRKVHESLDTFIRQTMGREPYMSFTNRYSEKPLQKILEHQHAMNKCIKNLKVDVDICDAPDDNTNVEPHQVDFEIDPSGVKRGGSLARGLQVDRNPQKSKTNVPQVVATYASTKNQGKQNTSMDHLTDLPGWPLLSPSKLQLQKCEKCSREFFSSFNHRRHTRVHRRISHVDKEDLLQKRKNVAAFWDKLNQDEIQQIFSSSKKYDSEDLSGEVVVNHLLALSKQNNPMTLPLAYVKAGQDLLNILDNKNTAFPLSSEQILSILDEANEKTFLCSQGDVSKIGLEEKNLVASLGFIVEQTLVKAWMANKDAEALRNQQELVKEEEAAQMKREKNVAKKKKKKEKSRQRGLKERKVDASHLILNEEYESIDGEILSSEIVEEDISPTASSTSMNSSRLENNLMENLEMEVNSHIQNANEIVTNIGGEVEDLKRSKNYLLEFVDEVQKQESQCDLISQGKKEGQCSIFPSSNKIKTKDQCGYGHELEQDQNVVESCKRTPLKPCRETIKVDDQDYNQRVSWISDLKLHEEIHQNFHKTLRKPLIGTSYVPNIESNANAIPGVYRGKSSSLKGTTPFPTTQLWAKKNTKDLDEEHTTSPYEMNVDAIGSITRVENEEFKTFEKKEAKLAPITSVANVVAGTRGLNNLSTTSFNLNANSEDWPPLSNLHATYYPKNTRMYPLTSYQCEVNSKPPNKLLFDKECSRQVGLEYKVEGSIVMTMSPLKNLISKTTSEATPTCSQKGIMIGSVAVPIGDYVHPTRDGMGSLGRRISTPLLAHQSYTAVLTSPLVQYTPESTITSIGRQRIYDGMSHMEFENSSNLQVKDSYRDRAHYKTSLLKPTHCMNFNVRHIKGPTFTLGDQGEQGILSKQPSWSSGLMRNLPQKVWRPVRPTSENIEYNVGGGINIESTSTSVTEKANNDSIEREENIHITLSQSAKGTQVNDIDISKVDECFAFATNSKVKDQIFIPNVKDKNNNASKVVTNCDEFLANLDSVNLQNYQEAVQDAVVTRVNSDNNCQPLKINSNELKANYIFHRNKEIIEKMDDIAHVETNPNHSAWISEAIEFHLSRWQLGLKDPETIIGNCEEEYSELQTSRWMDFMSTLLPITTKLSCYG
ncbi:hypothetical protein KC19_11G169100, partial [Ceratodon purpureus]